MVPAAAAGLFDLAGLGAHVLAGFFLSGVDETSHIDPYSKLFCPVYPKDCPSRSTDFPVNWPNSVLQAAIIGDAEYILFDWKPEERTLLHLVNLKTGAVTQFDAPPYFAFHYINTFETADGSSLCFDFGDFGDPEIVRSLSFDNIRSIQRPLAASPVL